MPGNGMFWVLTGELVQGVYIYQNSSDCIVWIGTLHVALTSN